MNLTALGVPLAMHAYPGRGGADDILMPVAMFLLVQTEFCYFGTSVGGKGFTPWDDAAWTWHALYNEKPGTPLANATFDFATRTWSRHFSNAMVTVDEKRNRANITILKSADGQTREFVRELSPLLKQENFEYAMGHFLTVRARVRAMVWLQVCHRALGDGSGLG